MLFPLASLWEYVSLLTMCEEVVAVWKLGSVNFSLSTCSLVFWSSEVPSHFFLPVFHISPNALGKQYCKALLY